VYDLCSVSRNQADTRTLLVGEYSIAIGFFFINRLACRRGWGTSVASIGCARNWIQCVTYLSVTSTHLDNISAPFLLVLRAFASLRSNCDASRE